MYKYIEQGLGLIELMFQIWIINCTFWLSNCRVIVTIAFGDSRALWSMGRAVVWAELFACRQRHGPGLPTSTEHAPECTGYSRDGGVTPSVESSALAHLPFYFLFFVWVSVAELDEIINSGFCLSGPAGTALGTWPAALPRPEPMPFVAAVYRLPHFTLPNSIFIPSVPSSSQTLKFEPPSADEMTTTITVITINLNLESWHRGRDTHRLYR